MFFYAARRSAPPGRCIRQQATPTSTAAGAVYPLPPKLDFCGMCLTSAEVDTRSDSNKVELMAPVGTHVATALAIGAAVRK